MNQATMGNANRRTAWQPKPPARALAAALCACTFLAFSSARAARLQPGNLQHVICKATAAVPIYSWLRDAPDLAVVIVNSAPQPSALSLLVPHPAPPSAALSLLEFSQHVRPPPMA
jgi:hypothetical protein